MAEEQDRVVRDRKRLTAVWAAFAALLTTLALFFGFLQRFGDAQPLVWRWLATMVGPGLCVIFLGALASHGLRATRRPASNAARALHRAAMVVSIAYLGVAVLVLVLEPFAKPPVVEPGMPRPLVYMAQFRVPLGAANAVVCALLVSFFAAGVASRAGHARRTEPVGPAERRAYEDLDVRFERGAGGYLVRVLGSPVGQASGELAMSDLAGELRSVLGMLRGGTEVDEAKVRALGARLHERLFRDAVGACLAGSLALAEERKSGLRIRLRLTEAPELSEVPWELLWSPALSRFLALSRETLLVRYLEMPRAEAPLAVEPPLRVLVMVASPAGVEPLDAEGEIAKLRRAVVESRGQGQVSIERLDHATRGALQGRLASGRFHALHFIGHGGFDEEAQESFLVLEDDGGEPRRVTGTDLGVLLHDHEALRLVVLNACEAGRSGKRDVFGGVAQALLRQGLPAVIAMQFPVTDAAAVIFARRLYESLASDEPVDVSVAEARKAVWGASEPFQWAAAVLHLRAADGRLFTRGDTDPERGAA